MILVEKISDVAKLLLEAAKNEGTVSFSTLHSLFDQNVPNNDKYDTLEAASRALTSTGLAIYSSVMAKKDNNCPGSGFYDIFNNIRSDEFFNITGHNNIHELSDYEMQQIAAVERKRVYEHAEKNF